MLQIHTIVSMPFAENTYILWKDGNHEAVVVDPGLDPEAIEGFLRERDLKIVAILNTHGHADHIAGNAAMKQLAPNAPLIIGVNDAPLLTDPELNVSRSFGFDIVSPPAARTVGEGDRLDFAGIEFEVIDLPGHSIGHVVFLIREQPIVLLGGDVLFRGSIGRTDFPGGDYDLLASGIKEKLYVLSDDTTVYPGHGPVTRIGHEKRHNPYVFAE
jgi:glyoxylase-like metal-dependent hydrolase (beta-lactamase superfamily II)